MDANWAQPMIEARQALQRASVAAEEARYSTAIAAIVSAQDALTEARRRLTVDWTQRRAMEQAREGK